MDARTAPPPGFWYSPGHFGWRASSPEAEQRMAAFLWQLSLRLVADVAPVGPPLSSPPAGPDVPDWLQRQRTDLGGVQCLLAVVLDPVQAFLQRRAEAPEEVRAPWGDRLDDWLQAAEQRSLPPALHDPTLGLGDRLGPWTAYDAVLDLGAPDRLWSWLAHRIGCTPAVLAGAWDATPVAPASPGLTSGQRARCAALFQNDYDALRGAREVAAG